MAKSLLRSTRTTSTDLCQCEQHPLLFVCMASPLIMEGKCVSQAWLAPHSFVLVVPSALPTLRTAGNGFQENFLNHLHNDSGETTQSVAPWVLLVSLLEEEYNVISEPISKVSKFVSQIRIVGMASLHIYQLRKPTVIWACIYMKRSSCKSSVSFSFIIHSIVTSVFIFFPVDIPLH